MSASVGNNSASVLLSALAKQSGHQVRLAFSVALFNDRYNLQVPYLARLFDDRASVLKTIEEQEPEVLAFSAITSTYQWMLGVATDAKRILPRVKTVFGGIHPWAVPDRFLPIRQWIMSVSAKVTRLFP